MRDRNVRLIDAVFALALFCLFTLSGLAAVVLGTNAYKSINDKTSENYELRTSLIYLAEKVRAGDGARTISIASVEGADALVIRESCGDAGYATWFFVSQGSLREVTLSEGVRAKTGDGQPVCSLAGFEATALDKGLIKITVTGLQGDRRSIYLGARCQ